MRVYILERKIKTGEKSSIVTTKFKTVLNEVKKMISNGQKFFLYELIIHKNKSISFTRIRETLESGVLEFEPIVYGAVEDFNNPEFFLEVNEKTKRAYKRETLEGDSESLFYKVKLTNRFMIFPEKEVTK